VPRGWTLVVLAGRRLLSRHCAMTLRRLYVLFALEFSERSYRIEQLQLRPPRPAHSVADPGTGRSFSVVGC
jgi:hypothetical protein